MGGSANGMTNSGDEKVDHVHSKHYFAIERIFGVTVDSEPWSAGGCNALCGRCSAWHGGMHFMPGDPVNVALIGTLQQLRSAFSVLGWSEADRLGLASLRRAR
jgi:LssY C-terminus